MSLEAVVKDIREEVEETVADIEAEADAEAADIIAEAERDAEETIAAAEAEAERRIEREREQQLSSANLQAKQERLAARRDVLAEVHASVEDALIELDADTREELTRALLTAGLEQFEAGTIQVYGRADDQELLEFLADEHDDVTYAGAYDCLGGVVLDSEGARVRVNHTFDSILEDVWEDRLKDISDRLFEQ